MRLEARSLVEEACAELGTSLADLIALASIWVSREVYRALEPIGGVSYPDRRRANLGLRIQGKPVEAVGQVIDGVTLDNNTYANVAFKRALGVDREEFLGFHICHIWPATAYDAACYTNLANLVAIPAELSSLTDHHPHIVACLKYRSWELYGWKPTKEIAPVRPERYPAKWREPWDACENTMRAIRRRLRGDAVFGASLGPTENAARTEVSAVPSCLSFEAATDAAILAAFYLSRFEHGLLGLGNQGQTIDRFAQAFGVNRYTLRNYRDYFDSHTGSRREGWKVPLPPQLAAPFSALMRATEAELREKLLALLR